MNYCNNGVLIGQKDLKNIFVRKYMHDAVYHGVHEFAFEPLIDYIDAECKSLTEQKNYVRYADGSWTPMEFVHDVAFLHRYLSKCKEKGIDTTCKFIQSDYGSELWVSPLPEMTFLGYEICEIPFDPWTLLDLFNRDFFAAYRKNLNENGLFNDEEEALKFKAEYKERLARGEVGDGNVDLYICKVFAVDIADLP